MRITYLVYVNSQNVGKLRTATKEEWSRIMDENRGLPCDKRRYFLKIPLMTSEKWIVFT